MEAQKEPDRPHYLVIRGLLKDCWLHEEAEVMERRLPGTREDKMEVQGRVFCEKWEKSKPSRLKKSKTFWMDIPRAFRLTNRLDC